MTSRIACKEAAEFLSEYATWLWGCGATCIRHMMQGCVHTLRNTYRKHSMLEFIKLLSEANAVKERIRDWIK